MSRLLSVLIVTVVGLGIEPRRRSLEDLGAGGTEDATVQVPAATAQ
jgi:hypothetical protein